MLHHIRTILEQAGITPTQQRLEIAQVMLKRHQHLSADQVLARVNRSGSSVSKATVYNTLRLFARKGIVQEVFIDPSRVFFDSNIDNHHHLYNEDTGTLTDISGEGLLSGTLPELPEGTSLVGIDVIIRIRNT